MLIFMTLSVFSQVDTLVIKPNGEHIKGDIIKPYTNKWKLTFVDAQGNKTPRGVWTDYGQIITLKGVKYFHRLQDLYNANMELTDTWINMVDYKTLKPVSFQTINPQGGFSLYQFDGNKVIGRTNLNKEKSIKESTASLKSNVFDWNLYGMLLVGLPFKKDLVAKLPFYDSNTNTLKWLVLTIEKSEQVKLSGKEYKTWRIVTNQKLIFWMSEESPYVIKLTLDLGNNSFMLWEAF